MYFDALKHGTWLKLWSKLKVSIATLKTSNFHVLIYIPSYIYYTNGTREIFLSILISDYRSNYIGISYGPDSAVL